MSKLKLNAIEDDKPVRLTIDLPATVHRDLARLRGGARTRHRQSRGRAREAHSADAGPLHGD